MAFSYTNPGGSGNRVGSVGVTANFGFSGGGGVDFLIDGTQSDVSWFPNGSDRIITFDFGSPKSFDEISWFQDSANGQGTWEAEVQLSDLHPWVSIASGVNLGSSATTVFAVTTEPGQRLRLRQTAGSTNTGPYIREIEFRIDGPIFGADPIQVTQGTVLSLWVEANSFPRVTQVSRLILGNIPGRRVVTQYGEAE